MEPKRALVIENTTLPDGRSLPLWAIVWRVGPAKDGRVPIEYRNRMYNIIEDCLADLPVPPPLDRLAALDPCYAVSRPKLVEVYRDETRFFSVYRCPHGNYFLEELRGGIAMYSRWIFLGRMDNPTADTFKARWRDYNALSDDAICYLGLGCGKPGRMGAQAEEHHGQ